MSDGHSFKFSFLPDLAGNEEILFTGFRNSADTVDSRNGSGGRDQIRYLTHTRRFIYDWSPIPNAHTFSYPIDEGPAPLSAITLLHIFKHRSSEQPEVLRALGVAGVLWLDTILEAVR